MKNKDRYNLIELDCGVSWQINGCGKKVNETREIIIYHNDKPIYKEKTQESLIPFLLKWLEEDS